MYALTNNREEEGKTLSGKIYEKQLKKSDPEKKLTVMGDMNGWVRNIVVIVRYGG